MWASLSDQENAGPVPLSLTGPALVILRVVVLWTTFCAQTFDPCALATAGAAWTAATGVRGQSARLPGRRSIVYARTTTFVGDPANLDDAVAYMSGEVWPALQAMEGCTGASMIIRRDSGKCISTSSWATLDALGESGKRVPPLRDRASQILDTGAPEVQEWEVAVMHRVHPTEPGAGVRAAWTRIDPARADEAIAYFKSTVVPGAEQLDGFASVSMMVDRALGRGVASFAFDSMDALDRTRDRAAALRQTGAAALGIEFIDVEEFELAFAHLHVPELV